MHGLAPETCLGISHKVTTRRAVERPRKEAQEDIERVTKRLSGLGGE